eukprot:m51a1_g5823 hypothetical protein (468) ;mRNA; r:235366-239487
MADPWTKWRSNAVVVMSGNHRRLGAQSPLALVDGHVLRSICGHARHHPLEGMEPQWSDYPILPHVFQGAWSSLLVGKWSCTLYLACFNQLFNARVDWSERFDFIDKLHSQLVLFWGHVARALLAVARETAGRRSLHELMADPKIEWKSNTVAVMSGQHKRLGAQSPLALVDGHVLRSICILARRHPLEGMEPQWRDYPIVTHVFQVAWRSLVAGEWSSTLYMYCHREIFTDITPTVTLSIGNRYAQHIDRLHEQLMLFLCHVARSLLAQARQTLGHCLLQQNVVAEAAAVWSHLCSVTRPIQRCLWRSNAVAVMSSHHGRLGSQSPLALVDSNVLHAVCVLARYHPLEGMEPRWDDFPVVPHVFQVAWSSLLAGEWSSTLYFDCHKELHQDLPLRAVLNYPEHDKLHEQVLLFLRHVARALRQALGHGGLQEHIVAGAAAVWAHLETVMRPVHRFLCLVACSMTDCL